MKKILLSVFATIAISIGTLFIDEGDIDHAPLAWKVIRAHGIFPYLVIFFAFWSLLLSLTKQWKSNILQLLPIYWGTFGFLWEQGHALSYLVYLLEGAFDGFSPRGFATGSIRSIAEPFEILLLGAGLSMALFTITTCVEIYRSDK